MQDCCRITNLPAGSNPGSNYQDPYVVSGSDSDDSSSDDSSEPEIVLESTTGRPEFTTLSSRARRTGGSTRSPATPGSAARRRTQPKGVFVGKWRHSRLSPRAANAVYASRDNRGYVNRRVSKEDNEGNVVVGGAYDAQRTACSHEDIIYIARYAGLSKAAVDAQIGNTLRLQAAHAAGRAATPAIAYRTVSWVDLDEDE